MLNPGAKEFVDFVDAEEATTGLSSSKPATIRAHFPINPLSSGESYLDDQPYDISLIATAAESSPFRVACRLWFEGGVLKLEGRAHGHR